MVEVTRMGEQDKAEALTRFRDAKRRFDEAHRKGMDALKVHDYPKVGEAIEAERDAIDDAIDATGLPPKKE